MNAGQPCLTLTGIEMRSYNKPCSREKVLQTDIQGSYGYRFRMKSV